MSTLNKHYRTFEIKVPIKDIEVNDSYILDQIQFDVNDLSLSGDTLKLLHQISLLQCYNSNIAIEIGCHTDARGNIAYNQTLSQLRAEAIVNFLYKNGIDTEKVYAKGYGESQPINACQDGVMCSNEKHLENRRVELRVISL